MFKSSPLGGGDRAGVVVSEWSEELGRVRICKVQVKSSRRIVKGRKLGRIEMLIFLWIGNIFFKFVSCEFKVVRTFYPRDYKTNSKDLVPTRRLEAMQDHNTRIT